MIGIRADGGIYGMDNALKGYEQFNWSSRWGPIFWTGLGYKLPPGYRAWSWTVISPAEDQNWTDPAGNLHPVGNGKVSHRSEEHTSELQSLMRISYAVFCLNKKKQTKTT